MQALIAFAIVGLAAASDYAVKGNYQYYGRYAGKCGNDGIYYKDDASFVLCSNGNSYVQPCAPGSRNGAYRSYNYGKSYGYADFCGVNLVDYGYGAKSRGFAAPSYGYNAPGYAAPGYAAPSYGYGRDIVRPDRYLNADGYKTRAAYTEYPRYGYAPPYYGYGSGSSYGRRRSYGTETSYDNTPSYGSGPNRAAYSKVEVRKEYRSPAPY